MMSKKRSQRLNPSDLSDEEDPRDYLQDPELLKDNLPQPFRMLDNLLRDLLYRSWEMIELREVERAREADRVKIPEVSKWKRVTTSDDRDLDDVCLVECSEEGYVFAGGQHGFKVHRAAEGDDGSGDLELVAGTRELESQLIGLDVVWNNGVHFIAAICNKEIKIFALIKDNLTCLCSIYHQSEDQHYVAGHLSPSASHIGLTVFHADSGMRLEFHKLPLESWSSQLNQFLEKVEAAKSAAEEGEEQQVNVQEEMVYAKPVLLCLFHPPKGLTPCPTSDPAAAFQRVKDGCKDHLPTGDLHILTQQYFDNRKKAFLSQHPQLAEEDYDIGISYSNSLPTFHFVYYQNSCRQAQPCFVVIWWENHNQIFVYPLPSEPGKNATPTVQLHWLLPQASPVVCSTISSDSKLLAVAQGTGVVTVWNFQTYFCESVSVVAPTPDSVTCMVFFSDDSMIGVGTEQGNVMVVCTGSDRNKPPFSLNQRVKKQMEEHGDLFKSSGYDSGRIVSLQVNHLLPSVLSSVHVDGGVVLWSCTEREALCKLSLPTSVVPQQCSYTSDGKRLLILSGATDENGVSGLVSVDMTCSQVSSLLSRHRRKDSDNDYKVKDELITGGFMEVIERQLQDYIKNIIARHEPDSVGRNNHSTKLTAQT